MHKNLIQRLSKLVVVSLAVFILAIFTNAAAAGASPAPTTSTFVPNADAYVDQSHSYVNYGRTPLRTNTSPQMRSYVRFVVSGLTTAVTNATLRIYATSSSSVGFEVHSVANNSWSENGITYRNAPGVSGSMVASSGPVSTGTWISLDVTSLIQGNGKVSFALIGLDKSTLRLASRESGSTAPQLVVQAAAAPQPTLLWSADMETADLTQWFAPATTYGDNNGGGVFNSGTANATASTDFVRGGQYSAKLVITTPNDPTSGTRLFRWHESDSYSAAYYSAWFYFPQVYTPTQFWNILQFKSKDSAGNNDPFWILMVGNRPGSGNMFLYLYYWQSGAGPTANEVGPASYSQSLKDLPVGKWVHLEAYLKQAGDFTGHITVWQDGATIFDMDGVRTRYGDGDNQWSVNNYSNGLTPGSSAIYVDDAGISTAYIP